MLLLLQLVVAEPEMILLVLQRSVLPKGKIVVAVGDIEEQETKIEKAEIAIAEDQKEEIEGN
jgi:hypothetical protein